jgi:superfamily I DNA/RNA helicase
MEIIARVRERGFSFQQIGYSTFTRAARREASERASQEFGVSVTDLERSGWFRTIHSSCLKMLGLPRGAIVNFDQDWLREVLQVEDVAASGSEDDEDAWVNQWRGQSPPVVALGLWDIARSRLLPFEVVYELAVSRGGGAPGGLDDGEAQEIIERYEAAKARDGRVDFTDILLAYAGRRMSVAGPQVVEPIGGVPAIAVQILDEAQDQSPLLDLAARRLSSNAIWYYLFGDREQGIYTWSGADPNAFMKWPVQHEEYLKKTWRCARNIIDFGLRLILMNTEEVSRELKLMAVEARCPGGVVETDYASDLLDHVQDPAQATLIMARTNRRVAELQNRLTAAQIPWKSVRGNSRWPPLASTRTCDAFAELEQGGQIDGDAWRRIVAAVPVELLQRGTRSKFKPAESKDLADFVTLLSLNDYGGTDDLKECIASGAWTTVIKPEERCAHEAKQKWGALAADPKITLSTIHGSKGLEADKVVLCTGIDGPVLRNLQTPEGVEEERRTWYVAATRARDHLVLLEDRKKNYMDIYHAL